MTGLGWLHRQFGRRAPAVVWAWRRALDPGTADGRLILADLARLCGAGTTSFVPGDPCHTAFREGQRSVLLHVLDLLSLPPETAATLDHFQDHPLAEDRADDRVA